MGTVGSRVLRWWNGTDPQEPAAEERNEAERCPWDYTFSKADIERDVGPPVVLKESFLRQSMEHLRVIDQEYETTFAMRVDIHAIFTEFRDTLNVSEQTNISECLSLGNLVGRRKTLSFDKKRIVSKDTDNTVNQAVEKFNEMANKFEELQRKLAQAKAIIAVKIDALEKETVQTTATEHAIQRARKQARFLQDWEGHIEDIYEDAECAAGYLVGRGTWERLIAIEDGDQ
jgi:DNA repair exonuclease SbcCD ATPase subunit